jgi:hypothetical protein
LFVAAMGALPIGGRNFAGRRGDRRYSVLAHAP